MSSQFHTTINTESFGIGTNLSPIAYWSTQYPFTNFTLNSNPWIPHASGVWDTGESQQLQLDEFGWLTSLPTPEDNLNYTSVSTFIPNPNNNTQFVVLYDGEGTINYRFGATKDDTTSTLGRDVINTVPDAFLNLEITSTDPHNTGNYLRNIRVIPQEYETNYDSVTFNPDFVSTIEDYQVLRFMEWMRVNNSEQTHWNERPQVEDFNYSVQGVPVEVMVELANHTGIDPWFTIPHLATDEYIANFAQVVQDNLDPELDVYVEFSNEVWNFNFAQTHWAVSQGEQLWPQENLSGFAKGLDWYSQRTTETIQIWEEVFNSEADRVIGVMSAQADNVWTGNRVLDYHWASHEGSSSVDYGVDAIAIAPYFGSYLGKPDHEAQVESWTQEADGGLDSLFEELTSGGVLTNGYPGGALQRAYDNMAAYQNLADAHGLELIAYEGGQHLAGFAGVENNQAITDLFIAANRDSRMGDLYREYFTTWNQLGGGVLNHHTDVGTPSKWGSWGALESIYQGSSPKYDAIREFTSTEVSEPSSLLATLSIGLIALIFRKSLRSTS